MIKDQKNNKKTILLVLDGWGYSEKKEDNALSLAATPNFNKLWNNYSHTFLKASGTKVGLFLGEIGGSETGHINLGAGRIVKQSLPRITGSVVDGSFFHNKAFLEAIDHVKKHKSRLHLIGLVGCGGIHSCARHMLSLLKMAKENGLKNVYIHAFTDGRDTPPKSILEDIKHVKSRIEDIGIGQFVTLMGRYYGMDRDRHWERTQKAYSTLTDDSSDRAATFETAVEESYQRGVIDEFIEPKIIGKRTDHNTRIQEKDAVIFWNLRPDRPKQLTQSFVLSDFKGFAREFYLKNIFFVTMVEYGIDLPVQIAFPTLKVKNSLSEVISSRGFRQLHIAESEKYAHVTYFFDGGYRRPFPGEEWVNVFSPKVPTYDLAPEMSARDITNKVLKIIEKDKHMFILVNFANADMVGHSGNLPATLKAVETIDSQIQKIIDLALSHDYSILITGDHGNAEQMRNKETGAAYTSHTSNLVPLLLVTPFKQFKLKGKRGKLADVAPTILKIMNIEIPQEMTANNLTV